jgi:ammonium transporter Rh
MADPYKWRRTAHIPLIIVLQIIFIILFAKFVVYDEHTAIKNVHFDKGVHHKEGDTEIYISEQKEDAKPEPSSDGVKDGKDAPLHETTRDAKETLTDYPMFQDVHVMIFIGFGFLMTFLKKYGLSAVSLNMLCAVVCLQWSTLVIGFFHLHERDEKYKQLFSNGTELEITEKRSVIELSLPSLLTADFASAAVLISFGVVLGKASPFQLIIMALIEIVLFVANEVLGRAVFGAIDAGDTIFVHLFGAYFGLAVSRVMYHRKYEGSLKQGSSRSSDMFSMVGTIFLWMFWPSFNAAAAKHGEPQHRAILNTYFSLCAAVLASFAFSAATNKRNKFVMEHIQNATLAGGVAIGACADLVVQPYGCLIVGAFAGVVSTLGYDYITPWLAKKMHTHDTCGVHNLHGMPAIIGAVLSCIMAALATVESYGDNEEGLRDVYPALFDHDDGHGNKVLAINEGKQAVNQLIASVLTFVIAITGGGLTGLLLRWIGKWQNLDSAYYKGMTVLKLIQSVGKIAGGTIDQSMMVNPSDNYFDDSLFFEVHEDGEDDTQENSVDELENNKKNIYPVLKGQSTGSYSRSSTLSTGAYSNNGYNYN